MEHSWPYQQILDLPEKPEHALAYFVPKKKAQKDGNLLHVCVSVKTYIHNKTCGMRN